ncbi:magnesium-chelatase subunit chlH, chloroplast, putative / Mg-protoporphyrin IX chelatase, putative [Prunus dulcis]|uniref:Magnesium-chelatase subunit chlH, chloroplast, putative / Mg-protoporphyrin IX chelatase, putative n=1 Tax=Prunus dulcis TaxID=3755 RepID=A0A4Y1RRR4_PRUDU|nr:magnesium-chelatase subunit chlH, chloroplast, putative / Mg-protoporphyrin IX chelatase, putative [Prunus dulcis]
MAKPQVNGRRVLFGGKKKENCIKPVRFFLHSIPHLDSMLLNKNRRPNENVGVLEVSTEHYKFINHKALQLVTHNFKRSAYAVQRLRMMIDNSIN